ncbi:MAG: response regulator [Pseudomonadales bacterium]
MNVLIVEDDLNLGKALLKVLGAEYRVEWVRTLERARSRLAEGRFDMLLLDLGLPDGDGRDWLRSMRDAGETIPVLIISARDELPERVQALDLGADDYLVKPFDVSELKARTRAVARRAIGAAGAEVTHGDLRYMIDERRVLVGDTPVALTPKEQEILVALMQAGGAPVARESLNARLGTDIGSNALEVHVHSLRRVLGRERIETVRGFGYRLAPP